jgi:hypothetical protein
MEVGIGDPLKSEVPRGSFFGLFPIPFSTALPGFSEGRLKPLRDSFKAQWAPTQALRAPI